MELRHLRYFVAVAEAPAHPLARSRVVPLSPNPEPLVIGVALPKTRVDAAAAAFRECVRGATSRG